MDKLEDFLKYSILFSYYRELFSKKQKQYLELYLEENGSLSEIAEEYGITRQAVFDNIKRGFKQLDEYEEKLKIFEKEKELKKKLENLKNNFSRENLEKIIEDFDYNEVL
ncbi:DNA-binding protein [Leptotrichia sp. OH3620_COT-345]|uniref:YlxM family DNA-binding protein n=1 Tax=Leptotrichia sp. OH3620_COT-345 TaxID=2491048 RepID=UPI000F646FF8|nr:sigma factor-like helix-turn-helix DNA-binding protein [Leptotrichia sp. OH3620_COT-345]RRD39948.1 DNA-binding protein [Leptotrichia sp. OH3620_COT-345]